MRKIATLLFACLSAHGLQAQLLLADDFNYSGNLADNGWSVHSGGTTDPIATTTGLTYAGYIGSGIGNAAGIFSSAQDVNKSFTNQDANGTVILMSALVNLPATTSAKAAYFLHLGKRNSPTSFSNFCARVYAKTDGDGNVSFGLSNNQDNTNGIYSTTLFSTNTTYLVIVKYTINTTGPDNVKLWVKTSGVPQTEAAAGTPDVEIADEDKQINDEVDAVGLRQTDEVPQVIVDGLRIGNDWQSSVLPVTLTSFKVAPYNNGALIKWSCAGETNVQSFEVLKSANGKDFTTISSIPAKNTSYSSYTLEDKILGQGDNYYQLKIIDKDGSVTFSSIQRLPGFAGKLQLYPNPVATNAVLLHQKAIQGALVNIYDVNGRKIISINTSAGATQTPLNLQQLAAGSYMLIFNNGNQQSVYKFIKK